MVRQAQWEKKEAFKRHTNESLSKTKHIITRVTDRLQRISASSTDVLPAYFCGKPQAKTIRRT